MKMKMEKREKKKGKKILAFQIIVNGTFFFVYFQVLQNTLWACETILRYGHNTAKKFQEPAEHTTIRFGGLQPPKSLMPASSSKAIVPKSGDPFGNGDVDMYNEYDDDDEFYGAGSSSLALPPPPPFVGNQSLKKRDELLETSVPITEVCRSDRPSLHSHSLEGTIIYRVSSP